MKKFYFLVFTFLLAFGYGQSVQLYNPTTNEIYRNEQYFCAGEKFNFKVDAVASSTGDYGMSSVLSNDFGLSAGSLPINFPSSGADKFSEAFPIGFNFSFYGKTYSKVVMGSNGRLVFTNDPELENLKNIAVYTDRTFSGVTGYNTFAALPSTDYNRIFKANPNQELNLAQIFFGYTDLIPKSANGSVVYLYKNIILGGVNGLMVSFQNQIRTNGTGNISSSGYYSYVLLLEDGRIVIYVNNKSETTYNAIFGLQNDDTTKFKVPAHSIAGQNYNNGPWKSEGKAWLFKPNQNLTPVFKWFRNGMVIPGETSDSLNNFTPDDGDVLEVEITYLEDPSILKTGKVKFTSLPIPLTSIKSSTCSQFVLETPLLPDMTYEWFQVGNPSVLSTTNQVSVTVTGSYFVRMKHISNPNCFKDSAPLAVNLTSVFPAFSNSPKYICKTDDSTSTTVDLYDYFPANPGLYSLRFQENGVDVPIPAAVSIAANTKRTFSIVAQNLTGTCTFNDAFDITFASLPLNGKEYIPNNLCFGADTFNVKDFESQFFAGTNFQFMYSLNGGTSYQNLTSVNPQVDNPVFVKIKHPNFACETVVKLKFNFNPEVEIKPYTKFPEHCFSSSEFFDLNITKSELEYSPDIKATFFTDSLFTNQITNLNYRGSGLVYIKVENSTTGCLADSIPQLNLKIYPKPALIKRSPETKYSQCGTALFNLTTDISDYIGNWTRYSEIRYYDFAGNLLSKSEWENYDFAIRKQPYMIFVYNETNNLQCSDRIDFDLVQYKKPVSLTPSIVICAETTYSLQDFKGKAINNPVNYTFTDLSGNPLPASFNLSVLPQTVNFIIKDNMTGCISDPQTITFSKGGNSILVSSEADYILCDTDFDGKTAFNLDSKKGAFIGNTSATFEYFKDVNLTQSITSNYTNETPFTQTIYVRITITGFCPSTAKINLKVNTPTKSMALLDKYTICFGETIVVDAGSEYASYKWSTGETTRTVNFSKIGNYSVILTNANGCPYTHNFTISDENQPKIQIINQANNSIEVIAEGGVKPYQYYFNGVAQSSNILQNPTASTYVIQVKSATGCLSPPKTVYFIKINNAFTPNADGINDVWKIENLDKMEQVSIVIVDRNGTKIFESTNPTKTEWDGKANGRTLPTATYWYVISWYDAVTQKTEQRQGWILMKNRN